MNDNKNHQVIIRAIKDIPDVKYVIVGKGSLKDELLRLAKKLHADNRVFILGYRTDIKDLLWMSDCFAFPSKREGLGLAALEGMSAGLPVVATKVGGIVDYLDEETGIPCRSQDAIEYRNSFVEIKRCYGKQISINCVSKAGLFNKATVNRIMKSIYQGDENY